jgi:Na+-driven multidrug efflux pump
MISIVFAFNSFFNGCGATTFTMISNSFANLCVRIPLLLMATDIISVGFSSPLTVYCQTTFALVYFYSGHWKKAIIKKAKQR